MRVSLYVDCLHIFCFCEPFWTALQINRAITLKLTTLTITTDICLSLAMVKTNRNQNVDSVIRLDSHGHRIRHIANHVNSVKTNATKHKEDVQAQS